MSSFLGALYRNWRVQFPVEVEKAPDAIKIGLLGASFIAPGALIWPAKSHPDLVCTAVAARDPQRAQAYAKKYGIPKVHTSYQELVNDPTLDAIYIPLPNSLHFEWTIKSLKAGKHVLLEKPSTSNATETRALFSFHSSLPEASRPVLLEAVHFQFHPAWQAFLRLVRQSGEVEHVSSRLTFPKGAIPSGDIRFKYELAGGSTLDLGTYCVACIMQVVGKEPIRCVSAEASPVAWDAKIDRAMKAKFEFEGDVTGEMWCDASETGGWLLTKYLPSISLPKTEVRMKRAVVEDKAVKLAPGEKHEVARTLTIWNMLVPVYWHSIVISDQHFITTESGKLVKTWTTKTTKKAYTWAEAKIVGADGEANPGSLWFSTYRYMIEEFVNRVKDRSVSGSSVWVSPEASIRQAELLDDVYEKAGLPIRPTAEFVKLVQ